MPTVIRPFNRSPVRRAIAACVIAVVTCTATAVRAQPMADRVPADAIIYVGWVGFETKGAGYKGSHLEAVMAAGQVDQFVTQTLPAILNKVGERDVNAREVTNALKPVLVPMLKHPTAIWIGKPKLAAGAEPQLKAGLICQAGPDADAMQEKVGDMVAQGGAKVQQMVRVSRAGDAVVVTFGYAEGAGVAADAGASLGGSAAFKEMLPHVVKDASSIVYVDVAGLVATVTQAVDLYGDNDQVKQMWPKVRDAIGVGGVKHLVASSGFDGKDWSEHVFLHAPEPRQGLVALADPTPLSDDALKAIPMTATMAGGTKFDFAKLIAGLRKAVAEVEPRAAGKIDEAMAEASRAIGMDVEKDLLAAVGDEWAYYVDPNVGGRGLTGGVLLNRLRDARKADEALTKLETLANDELAKNIKEKDVSIRFLTTKSGDVTIHYLGTPLVSPSWAIKGDHLVVGLYPQMVAGAAGQIGAGGKSILDNPGYKAVRQRLGVTAANGFAFMDLPQTAPDAYGTWVAISRLSGFGDMFGVKTPAMLLPPLAQLRPHLAPAGSVTWTDKDGIHAKSISPFPGATLLATDPIGSMQASAPLMASVMLPALSKAREQANRVKSASNLRQIGMSAHMFAADNKGRFPATMAEMVSKTELAPSVALNPRKDTTIPVQQTPAEAAKWMDEHSDYAYVGAGLKTSAGQNVVLAYEKPEGLTDGINILYADGHVEWKPMAVAMREIQGKGERKVPAPE